MPRDHAYCVIGSLDHVEINVGSRVGSLRGAAASRCGNFQMRRKEWNRPLPEFPVPVRLARFAAIESAVRNEIAA
jgi:hypothetical protein